MSQMRPASISWLSCIFGGHNEKRTFAFHEYSCGKSRPEQACRAGTAVLEPPEDPWSHRGQRGEFPQRPAPDGAVDDPALRGSPRRPAHAGAVARRARVARENHGDAGPQRVGQFRKSAQSDAQ